MENQKPIHINLPITRPTLMAVLRYGISLLVFAEFIVMNFFLLMGAGWGTSDHLGWPVILFNLPFFVWLIVYVIRLYRTEWKRWSRRNKYIGLGALVVYAIAYQQITDRWVLLFDDTFSTIIVIVFGLFFGVLLYWILYRVPMAIRYVLTHG